VLNLPKNIRLFGCEFCLQCALAAIVISAVIGLVDYEEAMFLWRVEKKDFLLWLAASIFTLFLGIEVGVLIGVSAFSLCT
jgi:sulfate transporter 4